jgi:hypothetical protein
MFDRQVQGFEARSTLRGQMAIRGQELLDNNFNYHS